jgi:para-nitrobenzyl esterase
MKNNILLVILCFSFFAKAQNPIIGTVNGKIQGTVTKDKTVRIFKGIPFAAAPIGDLRWKAPQPVQNWKGIKQCKVFSASPMQNKPQPFFLLE